MSTSIQDYLVKMVDVRRQMRPIPIGIYLGLDEFILRQGRSWPTRLKPGWIPWGIVKECYRNAAQLALQDIGYIYCEGYVATVFPVLHAWCVSATTGQVIDNTLRKPGAEYFGIAFRRLYLVQQLSKNQYYGLIDDWHNGWPLLRTPIKRWRHPIMR